MSRKSRKSKSRTRKKKKCSSRKCKSVGWEKITTKEIVNALPKGGKYNLKGWKVTVMPIPKKTKKQYGEPLKRGLVFFYPDEKKADVSFWTSKKVRDLWISEFDSLENVGTFALEIPYKYTPETGWMKKL